MGDTVTLWLLRWIRVERSGFKPWPGHCVVILGKTINSHNAHPPRSKNGYRRIAMEGVGGNLAMILILSTRESPVSDVGWNTGGGGVPCDQLVSLAGVSSNTPSRLMDMETRISSVWVDHLAGVQTLPWEFMITRKFFDRQIKLHESLGRIHLCWSFTFVLLWSIKWVTEWDTKGLLQIKDDYYNCLHFQKIVLINCKDKTVTNLTSGESAFLIMLTKPKREARRP